MDGHGHPGPRTSPFQLHRKQDQRGAVTSRVLSAFFPVEEAESEKEGVGSSLGHVGICLAVEIDEVCFQFFLWAGGEHLVGVECILGILLDQVCLIGLLIEIDIATSLLEVGDGGNADRLAGSEEVFQCSRIRADEGDVLTAIGEVEKPVASSQVEKFALPLIDTIFCGLCLRNHLDIESRQWRCLLERFGGKGSTLVFRPAGGCLFAESERPNLPHASAADVDRHLKLIVTEFSLGCGNCGTKRWRRGLRDQRRLERDQLLQLDSFPKSGGLVCDQLRELLRLEPDSDEGVSLGQDKNGIQASLLEGRSKQCGSIEAGCELPLENRPRGADLLTFHLKTRRRVGIAETQASDGRPDGGGQLPRATARAIFISINTGILTGPTQNITSAFQDLVDGYVVRHAEGG